jgi:predicted DNA-binding transcriptional regulator AlpA
MTDLFSINPPRIDAFRLWLRLAADTLESRIGSDDATTLGYVARVIRHAKAIAYRLGMYRLADTLPERTTKTPLDGCLRIRECLQFCNGESPEPTDPAALLTIQQVAGLLHVDPRTVRRRVADGTFPQPIRIGRAVRWRRLDIECLS